MMSVEIDIAAAELTAQTPSTIRSSHDRFLEGGTDLMASAINRITSSGSLSVYSSVSNPQG